MQISMIAKDSSDMSRAMLYKFHDSFVEVY